MSTDNPIDRLSAALSERYEIQRELGRGGMATVYLAEDRRHERPVAVKVMSPHLTGVATQRFLSEIRVVANLIHPHILPLHDSGETEGLLYYVMPFVDGQTLTERIAESGPLEVEEAVRILREVGDGLSHAHKRGIVHRDVKPSNIFLSDGNAFLADFGVAKAMESSGDASLTATGAALGTPLYMSPEQSTGSVVDERSDVYSLACVLYQMLTGKTPYTGPTIPAIMAAHLIEDIPSLRGERPGLPAEIDRAITRALAKAPEDRFASVEAFLAAVGGERVLPGPRRKSGRVSVRDTASVVGAVALIATAVVVLVIRSGPSTPTVADLDLVQARVVVAPLANDTGDPALDPYGRMGAEWITEGLHRTGIVDVVPSLTAFQAVNFIESQQTRSDTTINPIEALASETNAGLVISGTIYAIGDSLQYHLNLTDATTGASLDAIPPVSGSRASPGAAIEELRDRVMGSLSLNLDERIQDVELSAVRPPSYESYQAFDRGMAAYLDGAWRDAVEPLRLSHALDTTFVLPLLYAGLSLSNVREMATVDSLSEVLDERRGRLSAYHGYWLDYMTARTRGRNEEARLAIREAARLAPGSKAVYNHAYSAQLTHRPREAVTALNTLDPTRGPMRGWFPYWQMLTDNLHRLGEHAQELAAARRSRELFPSRGWSLRLEGEALAAMGDIDGLERLVSEIPSIDPADMTRAGVLEGIGVELRSHGYLDDSMAFFEQAAAAYEAQPDSVRSSRLNTEVQATVLEHLEREDDASELIEELRERYPDDLALLGWSGILAARSGDTGRANRVRELLVDADRADPYSRGFYTLLLARIAGVLDEQEEATNLLRSSIEQGFRPLRHPGINLEGLIGYAPFDEVMTPLDR